MKIKYNFSGGFKMCEFLKRFEVKLHYTGIKVSVLKTISKIDDSKKLDVKMFYPTNADAVDSILLG